MFKKFKPYKHLIAEFVTIFGAVASFSMMLVNEGWAARGFFALYFVFLFLICLVEDNKK